MDTDLPQRVAHRWVTTSGRVWARLRDRAAADHGHAGLRMTRGHLLHPCEEALVTELQRLHALGCDTIHLVVDGDEAEVAALLRSVLPPQVFRALCWYDDGPEGAHAEAAFVAPEPEVVRDWDATGKLQVPALATGLVDPEWDQAWAAAFERWMAGATPAALDGTPDEADTALEATDALEGAEIPMFGAVLGERLGDEPPSWVFDVPYVPGFEVELILQTPTPGFVQVALSAPWPAALAFPLAQLSLHDLLGPIVEVRDGLGWSVGGVGTGQLVAHAQALLPDPAGRLWSRLRGYTAQAELLGGVLLDMRTPEPKPAGGGSGFLEPKRDTRLRAPHFETRLPDELRLRRLWLQRFGPLEVEVSGSLPPAEGGKSSIELLIQVRGVALPEAPFRLRFLGAPGHPDLDTEAFVFVSDGPAEHFASLTLYDTEGAIAPRLSAAPGLQLVPVLERPHSG